MRGAQAAGGAIPAGRLVRRLFLPPLRPLDDGGHDPLPDGAAVHVAAPHEHGTAWESGSSVIFENVAMIQPARRARLWSGWVGIQGDPAWPLLCPVVLRLVHPGVKQGGLVPPSSSCHGERVTAPRADAGGGRFMT